MCMSLRIVYADLTAVHHMIGGDSMLDSIVQFESTDFIFVYFKPVLLECIIQEIERVENGEIYHRSDRFDNAKYKKRIFFRKGDTLGCIILAFDHNMIMLRIVFLPKKEVNILHNTS